MNADQCGCGSILVISPHLDDGVFGCAHALEAHRGAVVVTVFAGVPDGVENRITEWDAASGFRNAEEAMQVRRSEDHAALAILGAIPRWLDFYDSQYGSRVKLKWIRRRLHEIIREYRPDTVFLPLGLFHSDHERVHKAALRLLRDGLGYRWLGYEEALYRRIPGLLQRRLTSLLRKHIVASPVRSHEGDETLRQRAIRCYASQLRALSSGGRPGEGDVFAPERYWLLEPRDKRKSAHDPR
jgi:LmbE family N-acetylglucosaminyl deacetylase